MNRALRLVVTAAVAVLAGACGASSPTQSVSPSATLLPHSMKGYELYSWQVDGRWNFALMTGTNALKSVEQITTGSDSTGGSVKLSAPSVDGLKEHLCRLPRDESILWIGRQTCAQRGMQAGPLTLPPSDIVDAVSRYCRQLGLNLHVSP